MRFVRKYLRISYSFVTILFLNYKAYGSSEGNKKISIESDEIKINDSFDLFTNDKRAKLKAFIARSFANGTELDLLDHNALITQYHQIVNSSAVLFAKQLLMQKSIVNKHIRYVHKVLIDYLLNYIQLIC